MSDSTSPGSQVIYTSQLLLGTTRSEQVSDWCKYIRHDFAKQFVWGEGSLYFLTVMEDRDSQWDCLGKKGQSWAMWQLLIMCTCMCLCGGMCTQMQVPLWPEEDIKSPGAGVTVVVSYQVSTGDQTVVFWKSSKSPIQSLNLRTLWERWEACQ